MTGTLNAADRAGIIAGLRNLADVLESAGVDVPIREMAGTEDSGTDGKQVRGCDLEWKERHHWMDRGEKGECYLTVRALLMLPGSGLTATAAAH